MFQQSANTNLVLTNCSVILSTAFAAFANAESKDLYLADILGIADEPQIPRLRSG
jgi:hypothetical protein